MIKIAGSGGFCYGVKRAVEILNEHLGENVYTLGEIIHNPTVVNYFRSRGVVSVERADDIPSGKVIIRSHGAGKAEIESLKNRGIEVVDATCVFVRKIHEIVERKHAEGAQIVIVGKADHPEVRGINGWCDNSAIIIDDAEHLDALDGYKKLAVVCQTTFEKSKIQEIFKNIIKRYGKIVELFDTICYTTIKRQEEAETLSKECDLMVVIGGRNSSNTGKLSDVCRKYCKEVAEIECADDLDLSQIQKNKKIGIVAGASTPEALIKEVYFKMAEQQNENQDMTQEKMTMDDVMKTLDVKLKRGQRIEATISDITENGLMVSIPGMKTDSLLPKEELGEGEFNEADYAIGDPIEVKVMSVNPVRLSKKALDNEKIEEAQMSDIVDNKKEFSMTFNEINKGGLIGKFASYSVFVPASQIKLGFVTDLEKYKNKPLRLEILDIDNEKKKIVASQKVILEREREVRDQERAKREEEFWDNIEEGQLVEGKVVRIADFGAFVSINGVDCLAHKSDLSWTPVETVESVLEKNKTYTFKVLKLDRENNKVSLGYKQLQPHPWDSVAEKYLIGSVVKGKVARIVSFGAFVELEPNVDGLVHVSQICHEWIDNPASKLSVGEEVEAKVLDVDAENQRITLSIKALTPAPEDAVSSQRRSGDDDYGDRGDRPVRSTSAAPRPRVKRDAAPRARRSSDESGPTSWTDSTSSGASIGDMLKGLNLDLDEDEK